MRWIGAVLGGLCAGVGLVGAVGWGADPPKAPNLVLISLDTTRADALSCYGALADLGRAPGPVTPHIDALAADGLRLEHFYAHAPTTLSSHTSMHTGLDPHEHRVPRNGFPVPPELPTLAERLTGAGWQAIAVVGAAALERAMGLDRGFSVYDDRTTGKRGLMHQDSAEGVVDRALAHVAERDRSRPLFLFVHLYDPHGPYEAPEPFASRFVDPDYAGPAPTGVGAVAPVKQALRAGQDAAGLVSWTASQYLAEVAYADAQIGRLLDSLRADGVLDHALVVVTADHGEVMSEPLRFAYSHGSDVSDHVTHVPLVMWGSGVPLGRGVVRSQGAMRELAPTLERVLGLEPTLGHGDLWDLVRPGPVRDEDGWPSRPTHTVYMEATRPRQLERVDVWNNLAFARGVRAGGYVLHASPVHREAPVVAEEEAMTPVLSELLGRWDAAAPAARSEAMDEQTREALQALGYLD